MNGDGLASLDHTMRGGLPLHGVVKIKPCMSWPIRGYEARDSKSLCRWSIVASCSAGGHGRTPAAMAGETYWNISLQLREVHRT